MSAAGGAVARPARSWLYVPGDRPDRIAKALASAADAVVIDLEDAVPPDAKDTARQAAADALRQAADPSKPVYVRVNDPDTPWARADVRAVAGLALAGVRVPKCESAVAVRRVAGWLEEDGSPASLHLLIESALGVERAYELATASLRVAGLALGEADLRASLGVSDDAALAYARSRLVTAARAAGLPGPVQGVHTRLRDPDGLRASTLAGRALGFSGRSAIHPEQVGVINEVFTPTAAEVAAARELLASLEEARRSGRGVNVTADGRFVDAAVVASAHRTVALAAHTPAAHATGNPEHDQESRGGRRVGNDP